MMKMIMRFYGYQAMIASLLVSAALCQDDADDAPDVIMIYDVSDIVISNAHHIGDWLHTGPFGTTQSTVSGLQGFGGLGGGATGGGGGFGGGGGTGGGGFFSIPSHAESGHGRDVPAHILPQFGGGGMGGGGGGGGFGGGMGGMQPTVTHANGQDMNTLIDVIYSTIDQNSWDIQGGSSNISTFGHRLIVSCPETTHRKIEALLELLRGSLKSTPTMEIAVRIVDITPDQLSVLSTTNAGDIEKLAATPDAIRVLVRCANRRVATIAAGQRKSFVISATPVVGSNGIDSGSEKSIGYSPKVITPMIGVLGKIYPTVNDAKAPGPRTAKLDVGLVVAVQPEEVLSSTFGSGQTIDRIDVAAAELETSLDVVENQWTLAGLSATSHSDGAGIKHVAIVLRWHETN